MSAVSAYSDLYPAIIGRLPATPPAHVLLQAVQWTVRAFLKDALAWCEKLAAIDTVADEDEYDLTPAEGSTHDIHQIETVWLRTEQDVTDELDGSVQDLSLIEFDPSTDVLKLPTKATEAVEDGLVVRVVKLPHYNATSTAAWVMKRYFDGFVAGAVAYLAKQKGRPWHDGEAARMADRELSSERARATQDRFTEFRNVTPLTRSDSCSFIES